MMDSFARWARNDNQILGPLHAERPMLTCPMCKKTLPDTTRQCSRCSTDLSLLVDYVDHMRVGLDRAETLTRKGRLGDAVWAYLEVLEVDPENPTAREQVGQVVTAVRQFDRAAPGRQWMVRIERQARFRRWLAAWDAGRWLRVVGVVVVLLLFLAASFFLGYHCASPVAPQ